MAQGKGNQPGGTPDEMCNNVNPSKGFPDEIWSKSWNCETALETSKTMQACVSLLEEFQRSEPLGEGKYGTVERLVSKREPTKSLAVKKFKFPKGNFKCWTRALREVDLLQTCSSPCIVSFVAAAFVEETQDMLLVMECCDGGTLHHMLAQEDIRNRMTAPLTAYVIQRVAQALECIHLRNILHRDVKASNILVTTTGQVKLADFGLCCRTDSPDAKDTRVGTPYVMSPEIFGIEGAAPITTKTDVWSLGVLLRKILVDNDVYGTLKRKEIVQLILEERRDFPEGRDFPEVEAPSLRALLKRCLQFRADLRPTATEVLRSDALGTAAPEAEFGDLVLASR